MKNYMVGRFSNIGKLCYHFCAIVGLVFIIGVVIFWAQATFFSPGTETGYTVKRDYTVPVWQAGGAIEMYKWRIGASQDKVAKGYFISREAINFMLRDARNTGVFVYPGYNVAKEFCLVAEGYVVSGAGFSVREDSKFVMCETVCPNDCGTF